ncbi:molecular chaperone Hsp90 [Bacilliculturomica massiliensis]|uniref:molecular chaperone Hsp90 n=1 Tax=Bacilliculturomica massiliensis TaxID=1917867 RepID=UPI0010320968|nr:molecular chaperone Hsp90 [Bacilliculturomica massiliensis]
MDKKEVMDFVVQKTRELIEAPTCSSETKAAAQAWLEAVGTGKEAEETKKYIEELEADIMPIDNLIAFAGSDAGVQYFGAETAGNIVEHAREIKAAGAAYCDCPACAVVAEILEKKDSLLG